MFELFNKKEEDGIPSKDLVERISEIRSPLYGVGSRSFKLPRDQTALDAFYILSIYVVNNFPLPESHRDYLGQKLQINSKLPKHEIVNQLMANRLRITESFNLELPIRGIEVIFQFADFKISPEQEACLEVLLNHLETAIK
jgi:hypothetical protein